MFLGVDNRVINRWWSGQDIPRSVELLLELMIALGPIGGTSSTSSRASPTIDRLCVGIWDRSNVPNARRGVGSKFCVGPRYRKSTCAKPRSNPTRCGCDHGSVRGLAEIPFFRNLARRLFDSLHRRVRRIAVLLTRGALESELLALQVARQMVSLWHCDRHTAGRFAIAPTKRSTMPRARPPSGITSAPRLLLSDAIDVPNQMRFLCR